MTIPWDAACGILFAFLVWQSHHIEIIVVELILIHFITLNAILEARLLLLRLIRLRHALRHLTNINRIFGTQELHLLFCSIEILRVLELIFPILLHGSILLVERYPKRHAYTRSAAFKSVAFSDNSVTLFLLWMIASLWLFFKIIKLYRVNVCNLAPIYILYLILGACLFLSVIEMTLLRRCLSTYSLKCARILGTIFRWFLRWLIFIRGKMTLIFLILKHEMFCPISNFSLIIC